MVALPTDDPPACPPCVRRHPGGDVVRFFPHHFNLCVKHHLWLGALEPGSQSWPNEAAPVEIRSLPAIHSAQVLHRRLVHRHGALAALRATRAASESWEVMHGPQIYGQHGERLLVLRPDRETYSLKDPAYHAAAYPEIVAAASVFVTPRWQHEVRSPHTRARAYQQFAQRLGWDFPRHQWRPGRRSTLEDWINGYGQQVVDRTDVAISSTGGIRFTGPQRRWSTQQI